MRSGEIAAADIRRIVTLTLFPHWSKATTGSSRHEFDRALAQPAVRSLEFDVTHIESTSPTSAVPRRLDRYRSPRLRHASRRTAGTARSSCSARTACRRSSSTRGIRTSITSRRPARDPRAAPDPEPAAARVSVAHRPGQVARPGHRGGDRTARAQGVKDLLVVPLSFVSDHIETLYEVDMLFAGGGGRAGSPGISAPTRSTRIRISSTALAAPGARTVDAGRRQSPEFAGGPSPSRPAGGDVAGRSPGVGRCGHAGTAIARATDSCSSAGRDDRRQHPDGASSTATRASGTRRLSRQRAGDAEARVADLGLGAQLLRSSDAARRRYIFRGGRLHEVPASPLAFAEDAAAVAHGKPRLAREPFARPARGR